MLNPTIPHRTKPTIPWHTRIILQGKLYLSGNGLSERSAVLDLMNGGASAATAPAETRGDMSGANGDGDTSSSSDVVVVERCCPFHNEQV